MFVSASPFTFLIAAHDALPDSRTPANLVLTGKHDGAAINGLLAKLPAAGGHVHFTEGTFVLEQAVAAETDNVLISGRGRSTHFVRDGVSPCIDAGIQRGWVVRDIRTDKGGINLSQASEAAATYWRDGGSYDVIGYPGISSNAVISVTGKRISEIYVNTEGKVVVIYDDIS